MATSVIKQVTNNSGSGYCKMPDGTLIQWGSRFGTGEVSFQTEFVDINYCGFVGSTYPTPQKVSNLSIITLWGYEKKKGKILAFSTSGVEINIDSAVLLVWFAIGRWK